MTSLIASAQSLKGGIEGQGHELGRTSAIDLLITLNAVNVVGAQMFERDCLGFSFDIWTQSLAGDAVPANQQMTAADVLADIADIRALPETRDDVPEVDTDLLDAAAAIERYVLSHRPTVQ
jgi:hypothetical protein